MFVVTFHDNVYILGYLPLSEKHPVCRVLLENVRLSFQKKGLHAIHTLNRIQIKTRACWMIQAFCVHVTDNEKVRIRLLKVICLHAQHIGKVRTLTIKALLCTCKRKKKRQYGHGQLKLLVEFLTINTNITCKLESDFEPNLLQCATFAGVNTN